MADACLLSIDAGTTSIKVCVFDTSGNQVAESAQEYVLNASADRVEFPASGYWDALKAGVSEILAAPAVNAGSIKAASMSSQAETLICLDAKGTPLRDAIVWLDIRAEEESEFLAGKFSKQIFEITGYPEMSSAWPAAKILWIKKNEPHVFENTAKFLILKDYLIWKLTGEYATDPSESSSTLYLDVRNNVWWPEMLDAIGIRAEKLPAIVPSHEVVGTVSASAAAELGLPAGVKVAAGAMDQMAAALGAGNTTPGTITESTGTALAVIATTESLVFDPEGRVPCCPHAAPGKYVLMPYAETSGIVLKWFRETFPPGADRVDSYDELMKLASGISPGAEGLIALAHFSGTICPEINPNARGAFTGISLHHKREHFVRALVESVAFLLRDNVDLLRDLSIPVDKVRSLGGAAKSDLWLQIKANVLNTTIEVPKCSEAASLGAAMMAGVGAGIYSSFEEAGETAVAIERQYHPVADQVEEYQEIYENYSDVYHRLYGKQR